MIDSSPEILFIYSWCGSWMSMKIHHTSPIVTSVTLIHVNVAWISSFVWRKKEKLHKFWLLNLSRCLYKIFWSYFEYMNRETWKIVAMDINFLILLYHSSRRRASDSVTDSSVLSNPADAQNVSCLGLCGRDICPKSSV